MNDVGKFILEQMDAINATYRTAAETARMSLATEIETIITLYKSNPPDCIEMISQRLAQITKRPKETA